MRPFTLLFILLQSSLVVVAYADNSVQVVKVADPFLEMHTGPSVGYPIFHVIQRDETITVIKQRTEWYLIQNYRKKEGWVHRSQLAKTLTLDNKKITIKEITRDNYLNHDWEMSMISGNFGGLPMMSLSTGYSFTQNLSTELSYAQILGNFSSRILIGASLVQQPFPEWKVSPYFSIGASVIQTSVRSVLSKLKDDTDFAANVGFGAKMYLSRRFILRADLKKHIIFQSRNKNEEITSWQVGFAFFF